MFLLGVFSNFNSKRLSDYALEVTADVLLNKPTKQIVRNNLYELVALGLDRGAVLEDMADMERYAWGIQNNGRVRDYNTKLRHKEYNISEPDSEGRVALGDVNGAVLSSDLTLTITPDYSWSTLLAKETVEALELRDTLTDLITSYNTTSSYLESTYGFDLKELLKNTLNGVKESVDYLKGILMSEGDEEFYLTFMELSSYVEFYDFLRSSEKELNLGGI